MEQTIRAIDSIIKARDDNTIKNESFLGYLYSIMLSHIEQIESNLYNFKFIARILNSDSTKEVYLNLQVLVNDSSIVDNSKYSLTNQARLSFVKSYGLEKKENQENSFRIDFSINNPIDESLFLVMEVVNTKFNLSNNIYINKEIFFKISIFLCKLLNYNIIDGDIFTRKIDSFKLISGNDRYHYISESSNNLFMIYWNHSYIAAIFNKNNTDVMYNITYMIFTENEYKEILETEESEQ